MPDWWKGPQFAEARREWRWAVREIAPGVLTKADRSMLELYCVLQASIRRQLSRGITPRPAMISQVRSLAIDFGLTPSSRARISAVQAKEVDPFLEWLYGNRGN